MIIVIASSYFMYQEEEYLVHASSANTTSLDADKMLS